MLTTAIAVAALLCSLASAAGARAKAALEIARKRLMEQKTVPRILTINSWNEWTEGSYIEPDTVHGMKYLEAIRSVFSPGAQAVR